MALLSDLERIAYHVRTYRELRGWTQGELAKRADLAQPDVSTIENAKMDHRVAKLSRIAKALHIDISALFAAVDEAVLEKVS